MNHQGATTGRSVERLGTLALQPNRVEEKP